VGRDGIPPYSELRKPIKTNRQRGASALCSRVNPTDFRSPCRMNKKRTLPKPWIGSRRVYRCGWYDALGSGLSVNVSPAMQALSSARPALPGYPDGLLRSPRCVRWRGRQRRWCWCMPTTGYPPARPHPAPAGFHLRP